jgi:CHAD domain-containing protein
VKPRKVKGLKRKERLDDAAERIVALRLAELLAFMPAAADPAEVRALHDMRIAAKRLRYALEATAPAFGPYAATAVKRVKRLQAVLGEIHDLDVTLARVGEAGLPTAEGVLRERRAAEHERFLAEWRELERDAVPARLEYAIAERPGAER